MPAFACHGCGHCCRQVGRVLQAAAQLPAGNPLRIEAAAFPHPPLPDGACAQLLLDNTCAVYEQRPLLCRVDDFHHHYLADQLPLDEWQALNASQCPPTDR